MGKPSKSEIFPVGVTNMDNQDRSHHFYPNLAFFVLQRDAHAVTLGYVRRKLSQQKNFHTWKCHVIVINKPFYRHKIQIFEH